MSLFVNHGKPPRQKKPPKAKDKRMPLLINLANTYPSYENKLKSIFIEGTKRSLSTWQPPLYTAGNILLQKLNTRKRFDL